MEQPIEGPNRGNAGKGRPRGSPNRTTTALKEAILLAAEKSGFDGHGQDGLEGYLRNLSLNEPRAFASLLGKVLPLELRGQVQTSPSGTKEQRDAVVAAAMRADN